MAQNLEITTLQRFLLGTEIIRSYEMDAEMSVNHGFILVDSYESTRNKMSRHEPALMERWGWVQGDNDCWAFFVAE